MAHTTWIIGSCPVYFVAKRIESERSGRMKYRNIERHKESEQKLACSTVITDETTLCLSPGASLNPRHCAKLNVKPTIDACGECVVSACDDCFLLQRNNNGGFQ
jgi:hypothetical protein